MSLDGYIGKSYKSILKKHFISLEDDGYYWELYPLFEDIFEVTGEMIDLYDGATFNSQTQIYLRKSLEKKLIDIYSKEDNWGVIVGWSFENKKRVKVLKTVSKDKLIHLIKTIIHNLDIAKKENKKIIFLGD